MAPQRKSRGINKKYAYEVSPSKGADNAKRSNPRKRKLTDLLGPRWTMEELTRFYDTYRKHGKDWKKVSGIVRNRSPEMVEALYSMNRAYLSLPHGTASAAGLTAMMTDHYSNLAGSGSDQESNDGAGPSKKIQKRPRVKVPPTSQSQNLALNDRCMSLLKSGGSKPRSVGKRTPRIPVAFSFENVRGEKYYSPTKQGLKLKADADDDVVAHEIALALTEASKRGASSQVSRTLYNRGENVMLSSFGHAQRKHSATEMVAYEEDLEGSTEGDTGDLSRHRPYMKESAAMAGQKGRRFSKSKSEVDNNNESHLDDLKEEGSGTEEGPRLRTKSSKFDDYITDDIIPRSSMQCQRKKNKKILYERDEDTTLDPLRALADLSLMMATDNEDEPGAQLKKKDDDHIDGSVPSEAMLESKQTEKGRPSGVRTKGHMGISNTEGASKRERGLSSILSASLEENQDTQIIKTSRRKPKMQPSKIQQTEAHDNESPDIEAGDPTKKLVAESMKPSQSSSPELTKDSENSCSADPRKDGSDSAQSTVQIPVANQVTLPIKVSRRKMNLKKPEQNKELKNTQPLSLLPDRASNFKEKLSSCLSNQQLRKWCTYEWFYSAIDYPWFAKREFVEYLYHVGLGHVPRLTRVEWGVIRSSLGKPRRFSVQFLKEEKDKLNKYRDSVRTHYTELRQGVREGLPTDLARPLSVGQRVVAIHPKTREIHDGSVLTVDHSKCRIQFNHHELGVEFVMDTDCMPLNPYENMPALFRRHMVGADKLFENFNELKVNGLAKEYMKLSPADNLDSIIPASLLKQTKVTTAQTKTGPIDGAATYHPTFGQPHAKEADVQAIADLNRALHKKEAILRELALMNDDVENQKDGDSTLKDSEPFKKQYAGVLVKLHEANEEVTSTLRCLRERNTYHETNPPALPRPTGGPSEQTKELSAHANEIMDSSRSKAQTMVNAAMQALSSLKVGGNTIERIEEAIDYVNDRLPSDDYSSMPLPQALPVPNSTNAPEIEAQIPSELITKCIGTLLMIQKCTQRQFPPSDVAQILDSAVTSLQPCSSQNLPVYTEIQKCMGIIKNQILALIPT